MKVYLCGPINGCSDSEANDWRTLVKGLLPDTLDPMRRDYRGKEKMMYREIVELDKVDVVSSDALLVSYSKPSVGTSMEILYAWERGKIVVVVSPSGATISPWLEYHSHHIANTYADAVDWLQSQ